MVDVDHHDDESVVMDLVDDPVRTPAGSPQALEVAPQGLANAARLAGEIPVDELYDRRDDARRHVAQVAPSGAGEGNLLALVRGIGHRAVRRGTPNSARISSSLEVVPSASSWRA